MNIGIDIRTLTENFRTGVGEFTVELLNAVFEFEKSEGIAKPPSPNQYYLFANSWDIKNKKLPSWKLPNVHFVLTRWPNKLLNLSLLIFRLPRLDKLIAKHARIPKLDILYSPNFNFFSISKNTKHILMIHDLAYILFPWYFTWRQKLWHRLLGARRQCRRAYKIFTPSSNTKRDLVNTYQIAPEKISVLYPGLSPLFENFKIQPNEQKQQQIINLRQKYHLPENYLLFVGAIEPRKNLINLIKGFEMASQNLQLFPTHGSGSRLHVGTTFNFQLVIAGAPGWKNKKIYQLAKNSPISSNIQFIGYIDAEDKPALYAGASLFIFPSFYEGFGFPVLEAMSLGIPVITSNRSSLPEITGNSAYLINPNKPEEIAEGIIRILGSGGGATPPLPNEKNPGHIQAGKFKWENTAKEWLKICQ